MRKIFVILALGVLAGCGVEEKEVNVTLFNTNRYSTPVVDGEELEELEPGETRRAVVKVRMPSEDGTGPSADEAEVPVAFIDLATGVRSEVEMCDVAIGAITHIIFEFDAEDREGEVDCEISD